MTMLTLRAMVMLVFLLTAASSAAAPGQNAGSEAERQAIISLFEKTLSGAYSFSRKGQLPDFSTLDELYPSWDGGDPGGARRVWQQGDYLYYRVKYRVDSVFLTSDYTATVKGKKSLQSAQRQPMLWWFHKTETTQEKLHFVALVFRTSTGRWMIRSETDL